MALISKNLSDYAAMYDGYDQRKVGIGLSEPNIYASKDYAKRKTSTMLIGGLNEIVYGGFEHDRNPLVLTIQYEPAYNTILGYNLHYFPPHYRRALLKYVLKYNENRIKRNLPMIVDYYALKKALPKSTAIVRRYKSTGIRVVGNVPLSSWPDAAQERSRWEAMYRSQTGIVHDIKHWGHEVEDFLRKHHIKV